MSDQIRELAERMAASACDVCGRLLAQHPTRCPNTVADLLDGMLRGAVDIMAAEAKVDQAFAPSVEHAAFIRGQKAGYATAVGRVYMAVVSGLEGDDFNRLLVENPYEGWAG